MARSLRSLAVAESWGRRGRPAAVVFTAIVAFYLVLGLAMLAPEAVYSGDIGVKYVQARALASNAFARLDIPYPGAVVDPGREFFPMRPPFVMNASGSVQAIFPPVSAVLQAGAAAVAGIRGLILVSVLAAAAVIAAAWWMSPSGHGTAVILAVGLGGPLWFYAISGWEHAPAVAFGTAAFACALAGTSLARALVAGALIGAGATLRDEVLLLMPGLIVAVVLTQSTGRARLRAAGAALGGALLPLLAAAVVEVWWFERPAAAHLRHAVHVLQVALQVTSEPNPDVPVLRPFTLSDRYETVVNYWIAGSSHDVAIAAFAAGLGLAWLVRWRWRTSIGFLVWLAALGAVAAADLHEVLTAPKWLAGLFRVAPFVALAFIAAPEGARRPGIPAIVGATTASYLILAFIGVDTSGGKSLGPRLLLPLVPLLTIAAVIRAGEYLRARGAVNKAVGTIGGLVFASGLIFHVGGTIPAYRARNAEDASAVIAVAASPDRIVIADDPFTAQLLFPLYYRKIILLADSPALGQRLGGMLFDQRIAGAVLVSRNPQPAVSLAPLRLERTEQQGRMVIQHWRR